LVKITVKDNSLHEANQNAVRIEYFLWGFLFLQYDSDSGVNLINTILA